MASRCIRLTRIHAIQWFGYCDTFDIHGNLLIAGRTGAGKSVLMDLLQLVLIGDQRARYNAASDGRGHTSGRDKKSYCLCDTQEDVNGVAQYARDGGTTYIALEFTWPGGEKVETWGMRIEYVSSETQNPEEEFFVIPERLERSDFITPEGYALELDAYRLLIKNKDGETFRNITEYRKRLAEHLNFHRETIDYLMPSAMSFSFLPRFDEFCRRYILQAEDIKIEPVQQSYRSYLRIREELEKLQDKLHRLNSAVMMHQEYVDTLRDATVCYHLSAEFGRDATQFNVQEMERKIEEISQRQAQLRQEAETIKNELAAKDQDLESLQNIFRDKGGSKDEEWRPAIELAFNRKFAIVVSQDNYPEALQIYMKEFERDSLKESLVDPDRALGRQSVVNPLSLANKLECRDPVAQAVVNELFGNVVCVTSVDELRKHNDAIMADGFRMRGLFAERPRRYDHRPCIGAKGVERLKAYLLNKANECGASLRGLQPILARSEQLQSLITDHRLDSEDMDADIRAAKDLKDAEESRSRLIARKGEAATPELEKQLETINLKKTERDKLRDRQLELATKLQTQELKDLEKKLEDSKRAADKAAEHFNKVVVEIGSTLNVSRCDEMRTFYKNTFPTEASREEEVKQKYRVLEAQIPSILDKLKLIRKGLVDQHADLRTEPDFDPETPWNASYGKLLHRIHVEDMPARQNQAREEEQRWQDLFRTTVASRLLNAIRDVRNTINSINLPLKKPIGDSQYHIQVEDNAAKEFIEYRRVLDACAVTQEGQSIFASLEGEAREGVERVFKALVDDPDGKLAQSFLDYRSYFRYDMLVSDPKRPELPPKSLNRHSDKFSGGEKQTPFYISILACYLRAYKRHIQERYTGPSLGIVPIDEAFSKMSGERITDAIRALRDVELQGILSMSSGNWPYAISECDQILAIHQKEDYQNGHKTIRNIGALLNRAEALERSKSWE